MNNTRDAIPPFGAATGSAFPPVLDVCCGGKAMWFDRQDGRALYLDRRRETVTEILPGRNQDVVINPDILACFTDLPFPDNTFALVVMDPPHVQREEMLGNITKRYGCLNGDWREMLRKGFAECFRVLRPEGTLIFKWSSVQFPLKDILPLALPHKPLFGHQSGKRANTHWCAFLKPNAPHNRAAAKSPGTQNRRNPPLRFMRLFAGGFVSHKWIESRKS